MILPIQFALTYPERRKSPLPPFDFTKHPKLEFREPDLEKFRCLRLAFDALRMGGSAPCFLNAANEMLVSRFIKREIGWIEISQKLETLLASHKAEKTLNLATIFAVDASAREQALKI